MEDQSAADHPPSPPPMNEAQTRAYQQEMLDASLKGNIIVAQDTGSGKTRIAILRMKIEAEREPKKVSWFIAPTVTLCEQQCEVISKDLPVPVRLISGSNEPNQWKDPALWRGILDTHRIIVSTPQVLLDALRHGYVSIGGDVGLIIFDEAHHATENHPYNCIMKEFYFRLPLRQPDPDNASTLGLQREYRVEQPMILGLTASPIFGGDAQHAFLELESNLDSVIRSPQQNRHELIKFVHRPVFRHVLYQAPPDNIMYMSCNLLALNQVIIHMDIEKDPYILSLRDKLGKTTPGPDYHRIDQKLSKTLLNRSSYTHKGLRDLSSTAEAICQDIGPWAADWYIAKVIEKGMDQETLFDEVVSIWQHKEKEYLLNHLKKVTIMPTSYHPDDITEESTDKLDVFVQSLLAEKAWAESHNEPYSGIVFVTRRDAVLTLAEVLSHHPKTAKIFRIGCLLGTSENRYRRSFLDITRTLLKQSQLDTLQDFRNGDINLIVATAVAEEGLDIQACGNVIRWDAPNNMASWAQSRGRARKQRSSFVLMFQTGGCDDSQVMKWEQLEKEMMNLYQNDERETGNVQDVVNTPSDDDVEFLVESTGALLTLQSVVSHLNHFCSVLPNGHRDSHLALYDIDPPEMPEGWHSLERKTSIIPYPGPFGCTITLPKLLPPELRIFTVERRYMSKQLAEQYVAFKAYLALYEAKLLNDNLLPLTSVIEPDLEEEVKALLRDVEKRAGTATVRGQMDPWIPTEGGGGCWLAELAIDGLPPLQMFTLVELTVTTAEEMPVLYHALKGALKATIRRVGPVDLSPVDQEDIERYTHRLFWRMSNSKMKRDKLDFVYFFRCLQDQDESKWLARRSWLEKMQDQPYNPSIDLHLVNAATFGGVYNFRDDIVWVRDGGDYSGKLHRFVSWKHDALSPEEEQDLVLKYARIDDVQITLPVIVAQPLPRRINFLLPLGVSTAVANEKRVLILPRYAGVELISSAEAEYVQLLPSIIRHLSMVQTAISLRNRLFTDTPLADVPLHLLVTAITASVSMEKSNYERLETLGDAVLKFVVSINLLATYPLWHEGYLTKRKDHAVSNAQLAKNAVLKGLYQWIIRDRFTPRKWIPKYRTPIENTEEAPVDVEVEIEKGKKGRASEELSTKMLADVVESLMGAAYEHGSFDLGLECAKLFGLGLEWRSISECVDTALSRVEATDEFPTQLANVERMLGYTFSRKLLLVEALTHASHQFDTRTVSYERMEFLGDSVLDMIVTDYLYHVPGKEYSPGHMHMRKSAVVNAHFLALICLQCSLTVTTKMPEKGRKGRVALKEQEQQIHLYRCLLHSSHVILEEQKATFERYIKIKDAVNDTLQTGSIFPWASLTRLQAPKFLSDMIESLIGAIYLDSGGSMDAVRSVLTTLRILPTLERIVREDVDVLHPVSRVSLWVQREQKTIEYVFDEEGGAVICSILVNGEKEVEARNNRRGRAAQEEAKYAAAEKAILLWRLRDEIKGY